MKLSYEIHANIHPFRREPDAEVIKALEYFMAEAKAGRLDSVLVLGSGRNEEGQSCGWSKCAGNAKTGEVIDAFELWKYRKMRTIDEGQ